eukprot:CAMPEP_0116998668 /NCGR_PEP_ID=MMETSP0472-20121206/1658_1 /TAXON_ID=693140 ORGANISM="Tiarina fusus, Strain LIS" /NCGR_SAMPLE_ID=MMETSP0472 /ASSEMBLY_ACC=CAM_ASM_000603 /LENGTH=296 /DNA_ID=CAMNT_0004697887 /DNA_START=171 /DNA_END=1061 /DNA_ORIENTATION=-
MKINLQGDANCVFSRATDPVVWPYIEAIEEATKIRPRKNTQKGKIEKIPVDTKFSLFEDKNVLRKAVRMRRSVLDFQPKDISKKQFVSCLASILPACNPILAEHCKNFLGDGTGRNFPHIHFGMWITGVQGMKNGRYFLLRNQDCGDDLLRVQHKMAQGENTSELVKVPGLPEEINLFYCEGIGSGEVSEFKKEASGNSCHQKIAEDCSVVIAMLSPVGEAIGLEARNYAYMHWEAGFLGQLLYVQAYQQGLGATGMGCFLDEETAAAFAVGPDYTPIYHFAFGVMVKDHRFSSVE